MGSIVIRNIVLFLKILILVSISFVSCSSFQKGMSNHNGQYVPLKPNYKLKDKQGVFPTMLDTTNVYRMVEMYNNGILVYPLHDISNDLNSIYNYIKFQNNGRCLMISIPIKDDYGRYNYLEENDLNPNKKGNKKNYYYSSNAVNIQIESFVYGEGKGHYVILDYLLNSQGDVLLMQNEYIRIIYKKEIIPLNWKRYKVDW